MPIWFRHNGGIWNNNAAADPAAGIGGISLANVAGKTLYPSVQSSGGAHQTANFGTTAFTYAVPSGFGGCTHGGGGFTTWDPSKNFGSSTLSNGNLTQTSGSEAGMAQTVDGYSSGKFYYELTCGNLSIFAVYIGGGLGQDYTGQEISFWFLNGQYAPHDANGGVLMESGGFAAFEASIAAFGSVVLSDIFTWKTGDILSVAFQPETVPGADTADMADFWFGATQGFVDLSQAANRRKFIDANGCPLFLGSSGQFPFGSAPPVFLSAATGNAGSFATNNGLGGTFGVSGGSLALSSGGPCCSESVVENFNVPLGSDPQVRLSVSDDGGRTWNLVTKNRSIGKIGEYLKRIRWLKMGQFRQRVMRLEITDPVKRAFVGFYTDTREGLE